MRNIGSGERRGKGRVLAVKANESAGPDTQDQLLIAASDLMIKRGVADITLSDISVRSGLNSALVKYYFGNKAGLMLALLRKSLTRSISDLRHISELSSLPTEKLRVHISGIVNTYSRYPYINRVMHQLISENAEIFEPLIAEEFLKPVAEAQRKILNEGLKAGFFIEVDPELFYFQITGACEQRFFGVQHLNRVFELETQSALSAKEFSAYLYKIILNGISAPSRQIQNAS